MMQNQASDRSPESGDRSPTARIQALVTGGTRGIGRAISLELARSGYDVAFTYRTATDLAASLEEEIHALGRRCKGYQVDMADRADLLAALERILADFPSIQTLVNNAGISIDGLTLRYSLEDFDRLLATNVRAAFAVTQAALRPMMKARGGSVVFLGSVVGQSGNAGQAAYAATKSALLGMAKSLAKEMGSRGIRVNVVAPGFIKTDMTSALPANSKESILAEIPLGSLGEPEDVAKAVAFLASPAARYITGQVLAVNGGMYM